MKYSLSAGLLLASLSMSFVYPFEYCQKTFLMPRAVGVNKAMEHTTWRSHIHQESCNDVNLFGHLQVTPFFQHSVNRDETGRYFSPLACQSTCNSFTIGNPVADTDAQPPISAANIDGATMVRLLPEKRFEGSVTFNPDQEIWGARFDYLQYFNSPLNGLYFKASFPLVHVATNMHMNDVKCAPAVKCNAPLDPAVKTVQFETNGTKFTLQDYFAGKVLIDDNATVLRDPLTHAKINGRRSAGGVADVELSLGYRYHHSADRYAMFNVKVTVPTGNKVRGEYLFEPVVGNGHHAGLGAGVDGGMQLWESEHGTLWIDVGLAYTYLFEGTERRTLGIKGMPFAQYYLMSELHEAVNPRPFFPAANMLTRPLSVKPGSQFEGLAHVSFQSCSVVADIGYSLYWKDRESLWVKCWDNDKVGVLSGASNTTVPPTTPALLTNAAITKAHFINGKTVNCEHLDVDAAKTPGQVTHKIHGGLAYRRLIACYYPVSMAIGGSYEFAEDNSALEQYALWLKFGFSL